MGDFDNSFISEKLRKGEKVTCQHCHKYYYITDSPNISQSHHFYCPKCKSSINIDDDVIVE